MRNILLPIATFLALAGCAAESPEAPPSPSAAPSLSPLQLYHVPDFARAPYEPLTRANAVAIAMTEWRAFGQLVDDDPPNTRPPLPTEQMPDRMPGYWQRVGVYWWLGQNADRPEAAWTGKHDADGNEFVSERTD